MGRTGGKRRNIKNPRDKGRLGIPAGWTRGLRNSPNEHNTMGIQQGKWVYSIWIGS